MHQREKKMNASGKIIGPIVAVVVVGAAIALVLNTRSDRAKFDELKIGMTSREVQAIVGPKSSGGTIRSYTNIGANETLIISDIMHLTIRDGRLIEKKWLGKERR
jgi:hypothetical protein